MVGQTKWGDLYVSLVTVVLVQVVTCWKGSRTCRERCQGLSDWVSQKNGMDRPRSGYTGLTDFCVSVSPDWTGGGGGWSVDS